MRDAVLPAPSDEVLERLKRLEAEFEDALPTYLGYPANCAFDYRPLERLLRVPLNNIGDPNLPSNVRLNTHAFEREVLQVIASLTHAPAEGTWGYVTTGGTEGNLYGLFLARELFPEGVVYCSEDTHYSVAKLLRALHVRNIMIKSNPDGTMDLDDLRETLKVHRDVPPIVFANIGTTMKGAVDDVGAIRGIFKSLALHRTYVHADAALSGMVLPFVDTAPAWDFAAGVDSLSVSGHKMLGAPMPCGVVLAKRAHVDRIARGVEYIGSLDTTLAGSRNGHAPLILWYVLQTLGVEGLRTVVRQCLVLAEEAVQALNLRGRNAWRHPYSNTVVFDRPPEALARKWQLAVQGPIAHLITMPHVTQAMVRGFVQDWDDEEAKARGGQP